MVEDYKKAVKKAYELGEKYEKTYYGCGQCAIAAVCDATGMQNDTLFKVATGFAGGVGIAGDSACGTYLGGSLIISFLLGRERSDFADASGIRRKTYELVRRLHDRYIAEYGTVACSDIQQKIMGRSFYLPDADEYTKFEAAGGHTTACPIVVAKAAQWVVEILGENNLLELSEANRKL